MAQSEETSNADLIQSVEVGDDHVRVAIAGEIDLRNSPLLRNKLLELTRQHHPARFELDLHDVPYMDSSALAVLVELLKEMRQKVNGDKQAARVALVELQPRVRGLLHIARLDAIFDMETADDGAD
ncbi:MAG: STAS domain-containing protein [Planctomycetota bacterium]